MVSECEIPTANYLDELPAIPRVPGVYAIMCDKTGRYYVGSSMNIGRRYVQHRLTLRKRRHSSFLLQRAYDKYGERSFLFKVIEIISDGSSEKLHLSEKKWMNELHAFGDGFNVNSDPSGNAGIPHSDSTKEKIRKKAQSRFCDPSRLASYDFVSPDGRTVSGFGIAKFCRENGMGRKQESVMNMVLTGRRISYNGWRKRDGRKERKDWGYTKFTFKSPSGEIVSGSGLKQFCIENGLSYIAMGNVFRGQQIQHNGWRLPNGHGAGTRTVVQEKQKHVGLLNPSGGVVRFNNVAKFCRENNLALNSVRCVLTGRTKTHKGWRKSPCL